MRVTTVEEYTNYSMSSLRDTEHAFNFNFIVCRELVMTVNIFVQERNVTSRIVASAGSLTRSYNLFILPIKMAA